MENLLISSAHRHLISGMELFGTLPSGEEIAVYEITNATGMRCRCMNFGATVVSLEAPDRDGLLGDVVLGFDTLEPYLDNKPYIGQTVGRVAGRIPGGKISVNGKDYQLALTDGPNHLHGGVLGLGRRVWKGSQNAPHSVTFTYRSPDGEEGYPGNVDIRLTYSLTDDNALVIDSEATTDSATPLSLTNHSYFQLGNEPTALNQEVQILASHYVPADEDGTLSGRAEPVAGNDLRQPRKLSEALPTIFRAHEG